MTTTLTIAELALRFSRIQVERGMKHDPDGCYLLARLARLTPEQAVAVLALEIVGYARAAAAHERLTPEQAGSAQVRAEYAVSGDGDPLLRLESALSCLVP